MHERALMNDVIRQLEAVAQAEGALRVTGLSVRLGALSHFDADHFREHFVEAARGTVAEGAVVDARIEDDIGDPRSRDVVIETVEVES